MSVSQMSFLALLMAFFKLFHLLFLFLHLMHCFFRGFHIFYISFVYIRFAVNITVLYFCLFFKNLLMLLNSEKKLCLLTRVILVPQIMPVVYVEKKDTHPIPERTPKQKYDADMKTNTGNPTPLAKYKVENSRIYIYHEHSLNLILYCQC